MKLFQQRCLGLTSQTKCSPATEVYGYLQWLLKSRCVRPPQTPTMQINFIYLLPYSMVELTAITDASHLGNDQTQTCLASAWWLLHVPLDYILGLCMINNPFRSSKGMQQVHNLTEMDRCHECHNKSNVTSVCRGSRVWRKRKESAKRQVDIYQWWAALFMVLLCWKDSS